MQALVKGLAGKRSYFPFTVVVSALKLVGCKITSCEIPLKTFLKRSIIPKQERPLE